MFFRKRDKVVLTLTQQEARYARRVNSSDPPENSA